MILYSREEQRSRILLHLHLRKFRLRKANLRCCCFVLIEQLHRSVPLVVRKNVSKNLRATSVLLLCFVSAILLSGCAGMLSSNPGNPPPTAGDSGGNGGGSGSNNTPETLYESFTDFTTIPRTQGLRAFKVDPGNGTLSQLPGFPVSGPVEIQRADPTGKLIFSVHVDFSGPNSTTAYQINPSTAALTHSADNPGIGGALFFH